MILLFLRWRRKEITFFFFKFKCNELKLDLPFGVHCTGGQRQEISTWSFLFSNIKMKCQIAIGKPIKFKKISFLKVFNQ